MEEGTLAKWHVKVGDSVKSGDVIAEIETDKATMEVEAVDEGVVDALLVAEGTEEVKVNTPIARLKGEGEAPAAKAASTSASPSPRPPAPQKGEDKAKSAPVVETRPAPPQAGTPRNGAGGAAPVKAADDHRILASPLARRLAARSGVDLATVKGSGPHGRIIRRDLEGVAAPPAASAAAAVGPAPQAARSLEQMGIAAGSYDLIALDGMKKTVARRMTESFRDVPHFPLTIDMEIDALLAARASINAMLEAEGAKVSVNDMVIKAAAAALRRVPAANASYTPEGIALHHHADIAVAVAIEGGLITPIVRAAETKGVAQIAREMKDLAERARARKLKPEEYQGGTFSISNLGMYGVREFSAIINPPHATILAVGAARRQAIEKPDGGVAFASMLAVTLSCDHRVLDGAIGAELLAAFKAFVEMPVTMLV